MEKKDNFICCLALKMIKFRWLIAFFLFVILVFFKIHFSSMEMYDRYFPTVLNKEQQQNHIIFGEERPIRSDEWAVHTPKYFSQKYNNFARYSNRGSIGEIDSVLNYYAPSMDLTLIGKPFNLGYILFGNAYGISFYFCMLEILLFMTALEMFLILTKRKYIISFIGMMLVGAAPAMQWWLVPHITIVFVYFMATFCCGYYFLICRKKWQKAIFSFLLCSSLIGFTLSIFPSCQVVLGLFGIFLMIAVLMRDREKICFKKIDCIFLGLCLTVFLGVILEFVITSKEELQILASTDYPGSRMWVGGERKIDGLFSNLTLLFLPYTPYYINSNNCEISDFVHFAPALFFIFNKIYCRLKRDNDRDYLVGKTLAILVAVAAIFMCVGFSPKLAKITLFKYANRMPLCYGFFAAIFSCWSFGVIWDKKNILKIRDILICCCLYCGIYLTLITEDLIKYIGLYWLVFEIALFVLLLFLLMKGFRKISLSGVVAFMSCCGLTVNPVCVGIAPIVNHPISRFVNEKAKENKDDLWLCLGGDSSIVGSFLKANGARVLSTTHFYPDKEEWSALDVDESQYKIFNRYCHQNFFLTDKKNNLKLKAPDSIEVYVQPVFLKKMNIKYVVVRNGYFAKIKHLLKDFSLHEEFFQDDFKIFSVNFS